MFEREEQRGGGEEWKGNGCGRVWKSSGNVQN